MAADRVGAANVSPDQPLLAIAGVSNTSAACVRLRT